MDNDEDLDQFNNEEDRVKPIDFGNPAPPSPQRPDTEPPDHSRPKLEPAASEPGANPVPPPEKPPEPEPFLKDEVFPDDEPEPPVDQKAAKGPKGWQLGGGEPNYIYKDSYIDIIEAVPTLKRIVIGAGWDQKSVEEHVDADLSLFLCNKFDQTRIDEDFVFYNNERGADGAVQHRSDSRSGAGAGDDESIFIDLNGLSFDILKIICVLSIYDPEIKGHHFGMLDNVYIRIFNKDDNVEIFRYKLDEKDCSGGTAIIVGTLIREGPKWIYEAAAHNFNGGLAKVATDYGIVVKELQSTLDVDDAELAAAEKAEGKDPEPNQKPDA